MRDCEPKLSYIVAELFIKCLKETCFPDCWKISSVVPVLRMLGKGLKLKTTALSVFFSVVSKVFEKLVNNRIVDHLEKFGLFSDFHC